MKIELKKTSGYISRRRYLFRKFTQVVAMFFFVGSLVFMYRGIDNNLNFWLALFCTISAGGCLWVGGSLE